MGTPQDKALGKMVGKGNVLKGKNIEAKKEKYTGKKGEYSKTKQGNFMKVHPLDRI